jgi:acyl-CoA reductase-like NAD-dependent aldehyde dehydrogenase
MAEGMTETVEGKSPGEIQAANGERSAAPAGNGQKTFSVDNPATGETIGELPALSAEEVEERVAKAREAQPGWNALGYEGRARIFKRCQKWVLDHADRVIETICRETGKTWEDAQLSEVTYAAQAFAFWSKTAPKYLADEKVRASSLFVKGKKMYIRYEPRGVVGVIGPWNFPLTNSFGDCIPALAAGNSAVLKPSRLTPYTSLLMEEMLGECGMPENVYQTLTGGADTANAMIDAVDFVMFTGSTEVGKQVAERAAKTLTPVGLELGGKDPMIVLRDANLERAAGAAAFWSMVNGGQVCISVERAYVEEPIYDDFVKLVSEKVEALRQGAPGGPGSVDVGAVTAPPQVELIDGHVKDAKEKGARVMTGGEPGEGPGRYYKPTVIADADHSMECMTEETFGPTLPIMKVRDVEEAIRLANESNYGLQGSVWTKDLRKGQEVAERVQAGAVCVNDANVNYAALELPMGGWKESGIGVRHGAEGIRKYCRRQSILVNRLSLKRDLYWYPYTEKATNRLLKAIKLLYGRGKPE